MWYFILGVVLVLAPPVINDTVHYIQEKKHDKRKTDKVENENE